MNNRAPFQTIGILLLLAGLWAAAGIICPSQGIAADPQQAEQETNRDAGWAAKTLAELIDTDDALRDELGLEFDVYQEDLSDLPIGVFDSGVGGLTILEALLTIDQHQNATGQPGGDGIPDFQNEQFIYLGDQANMPYGNYAAAGREDYLRQLILKDAVFLLGRRYWPEADAVNPLEDKPPVKAIVIACNTATAFGLDDVRAALRRWDVPIPVVGVVEAGAESVVRTLPREGPARGTIAVLATTGTCASNAYPRAITRAAGQTGRRAPSVWQQGSLGLAGAIEGNPAFLFPRSNRSVSYEGPAVANGAAPIEPELATVYDFEPDGLVGDPNQPETWRLRSVENYVRYDVTTMMENYRRSGATQPIESVVLGCTHFPYEADRILAALERLRQYQDMAGDYPYRDLIADEVRLVDPGARTAQQLYRRLFLERRLNRDGDETPPSLHRVFISVPTPAVAAELRTKDGGFSSVYKYGRQAGTFDVEDVRIIPLDPAVLPDAARDLLKQHAPRTWRSLVGQRRF